MASLREQTGKTPPNLRLGTARANCGLCVHFKATSRNGRQGVCQLYGDYSVRASQVCDSFEPRGGGSLSSALQGGGRP